MDQIIHEELGPDWRYRYEVETASGGTEYISVNEETDALHCTCDAFEPETGCEHVRAL